jgi:hypothetical protein
MHDLPFSFGIVDLLHLRMSLSVISRLRFYHVGMSKQFARRLGTHFRYGLVWCVSIARNFPGTNEVYMMMTVETLARAMCLLRLISIQ